VQCAGVDGNLPAPACRRWTCTLRQTKNFKKISGLHFPCFAVAVKGYTVTRLHSLEQRQQQQHHNTVVYQVPTTHASPTTATATPTSNNGQLQTYMTPSFNDTPRQQPTTDNHTANANANNNNNGNNHNH